MSWLSQLLLCLLVCKTVKFLDYKLPESLGMICRAGPPALPVTYGSWHIPKGRQRRAGLVKTIHYKKSRSSLTLVTLNFSHFRHLNQRTFQDQQKQAIYSGGDNLTIIIPYDNREIQTSFLNIDKIFCCF